MALTFNVLNLETALRSAHARAGHTWFQAMTAVPMARLSVILRALRVEARRQVCPGPGSIGTAGAGRHPRADPAASHARPVLRQGIARPGGGRDGPRLLCPVRPKRRPCCWVCHVKHGDHEAPRRRTKVRLT